MSETSLKTMLRRAQFLDKFRCNTADFHYEVEIWMAPTTAVAVAPPEAAGRRFYAYNFLSYWSLRYVYWAGSQRLSIITDVCKSDRCVLFVTQGSNGTNVPFIYYNSQVDNGGPVIFSQYSNIENLSHSPAVTVEIPFQSTTVHEHTYHGAYYSNAAISGDAYGDTSVRIIAEFEGVENNLPNNVTLLQSAGDNFHLSFYLGDPILDFNSTDTSLPGWAD